MTGRFGTDNPGWTTVERRWRDDLLGALIPPQPDGALPGLGELDLEAFWSELRGAAPPLLRVGLRVSVWGLALCPPLLLGRWTTVSGLMPAERERLLAACERSPSATLRRSVQALKVIGCLAYGGDAAVRRALAGDEGLS